ncbi:hypothetical protein BT69DRAFT_1260872 [Atractiella rhizophila]|nr:hypothetical protein BT69DRAFT_1260872 [Atractiella rhizophila]
MTSKRKRASLVERVETRDSKKAKHKQHDLDAFDTFLFNNIEYFNPLVNHPKSYLSDPPANIPEPVQYVLEEQPDEIKGEMKGYQLEGFSFLTWMGRNRFPCILGDEMGLGKTLQTIAFLQLVYSRQGGPELAYLKKRPALVICPLSVLNSWSQEVARWSSLKAMPMHGAVSERTRLKEVFRTGKFDILLTTYDVYRFESGWFNNKLWGTVILDEGHKIKCPDTQLTKVIQGCGGLWRLILSGTTVQNNMVELWSLLHWLYPRIFTPTTLSTFQTSFSLSEGTYDPKFISQAGKLLSLIMRRRTKASLGPDVFPVPPKVEMTLTIPLCPAQRFWYLALLKRIDLTLLSKTEDGAGENKDANRYKTLMNLLMQLRKVCNHPYTIMHAEPDPYQIGEHIVDVSSKLQLLDKLLQSLKPEQKVLIFSGFTSMLDYVEDFLALRGISHARLDGSTPRARRTLDMKLFQQEKNSPYRVYVISTRAGGLGITLTAADTVVMLDSDWNPQVDIQAIARAHRIGQTKPVNVYRFVIQGSVEEQMLRRVRKKLYLATKVDSSFSHTHSTGGDELERMTLEELRRVLSAGKQAVGKWNEEGEAEQEQVFAEWQKREFSDFVREAQQKEEEEARRLELSVAEERTVEEEEGEFFNHVERVETTLFEGKKVEQAIKDIAKEFWQVEGKRRRQERVVMVNGYAVAAETIGCSRWEAVKTVTSDPEAAARFSNKKRKSQSWEHESWCIYCRDGGELHTCMHCPRVAHLECTDWSLSDVNRSIRWRCPQHSCTTCLRTAAECGGLVFRCQTCPDSFCEDCLPPGDLFALGEESPEFSKLGFPPRSSAFYIRCDQCVSRFELEGRGAHAAWFGDDLDWRDDPIVGLPHEEIASNPKSQKQIKVDVAEFERKANMTNADLLTLTTKLSITTAETEADLLPCRVKAELEEEIVFVGYGSVGNSKKGKKRKRRTEIISTESSCTLDSSPSTKVSRASSLF